MFFEGEAKNSQQMLIEERLCTASTHRGVNLDVDVELTVGEFVTFHVLLNYPLNFLLLQAHSNNSATLKTKKKFLCRTQVASGYGNTIVDHCNQRCNYHSLSATFSRRKATRKEITKRFEDHSCLSTPFRNTCTIRIG